MKLTAAQLRKIIKEEIEHVNSSTTGPADPVTFEKVYNKIKSRGAVNIPLEDLLALPAWFDSGASSTDSRMESAYKELIETLVTISDLDELVAAYYGT